MLKYSTVMIGLILCSNASAQEIQPFSPPVGFSARSNINHVPDGSLLLYNGTSSNANWHVAPMGEAGDFGALQQLPFSGGTEWYENNKWAQAWLLLLGGYFDETLQEDGSQTACLTQSGAADEHDLDVEPNGPTDKFEPYPGGLNTAHYTSQSSFPSLGALATMKVHGWFQVPAASEPLPVSPCVFNHGEASFGVILTDTAVTPRQMVWYGLQLISVCEPADASKPTDLQYRVCQEALNNPKPVEYWTGAAKPSPNGNATLVNFAWSDHPNSFNMTELAAPGTQYISIDLLPRLTALIGAGQYGIDPNLADWRVSGFTMGQSIFGDVLLSTRWKGFVPQWTVKPQS